MNTKYQQLGDEQAPQSKAQDVYSQNNSVRGTIINKESYISEESQQSSAMSLELRQKVNDQFQRKKMEYYKMYNKNPKEYREERGRRVGRGNKVGYGVQEGDALSPDQEQDEQPDVEQYSDYYEEEEEGPGKQSKPNKEDQKAKKDDQKQRKQYEKEQQKQAKDEDAQRKKEEKERLAAEKKALKEEQEKEKKEEQERLRQQKEAEKNMNEEEKRKYREQCAKEKEERLKKKEEEKKKKAEDKSKSAAEKQAAKDKKAQEKQEAAEYNAQKRQEQKNKQFLDKQEASRKKSEAKQKNDQEKEMNKQRKVDEKSQKQAQTKEKKEREAEQRKVERARITEEKKKELEEKQAQQDKIRAQKQAEKDAADAQKQAQQDAMEADKIAEEEAKAEEQATEQQFKQEDTKDQQQDNQELEELKKQNDQEGIKKKKEQIKQREEKKKQERVEKKKKQKEASEQKKAKRKEEIKEKKKKEYEKKMVEVKKKREEQEVYEKEVRKRQNERKAQEIANKKVKGDEFDDDPGDLKELEGFDDMNKLSPQDQKRSDKFCSKFCWMLWLSIPSMVQVGTLFAQEIINQYIVGRTGDYSYLDALAMSNFLIYLGVYGTAIVFNCTLETLVPHALATNKYDVAGHLLNRALFVWVFFFGLLFAGIFWIDEILINGLEWNEEEAQAVQEYMVFASPALFLWGVMDAHRRFINSFQKFWTPCITMGITVATHPFICKYFLVDEGMGLQGLAIAQLITNFVSWFFMRMIANCNFNMRKSLFFPRCKTCANLWQYLSFGIPQLIMFWIDTWQWQLMAFAAGWFGMVQQYATIALLTFLMICLLPGISMASTSASLVGSKIGCANVTSAQFYFRSAFIVQTLVCIGECVALSVFMTMFLERLTENKQLYGELESVYLLFILNVFLDSMRAMMKGVLRGVGIQNSVLPYHILLQGMVLPGVMYAFAFNVCEQPIMGIWIAMSIVDGLLLVTYWGRLVTTDWHEIAVKVIKRTNKIAGQIQDQEELLKKPGTSEL